MIELENRTVLAAELQSLAAFVLQIAKQKGATSAEVNIDKGTGLSTEVRMDSVDKLEYHRDQGVSITVYSGHKKGNASSGDLSRQALQDTVEAACRIACYTAEDDFNGLAAAELMASHLPELDLYHPWELDATGAIEYAKQMEQIAHEQDTRIVNSDGSSVESYAGMSVYANSHGFTGVNQSTHHSASCVLVAKEGDSMQRDYWYSVARAAPDLESAESIAKKAASRTVQRLHARSLPTQDAPVLFSPTAAKGLIGSFVSAVSGGAQYRRATFLPDSIGQQIFPSFVQLREEPHLLRGLSSRAYDSEGVATQARDVLKNGVLQGYFLGSYSARKLGMQTTGNANGSSNLILASTGESFATLLRQLDTGLLVTDLMGGGVNSMTGDYSRGASGFWVEKGEIQFPVEEITIASNLKTMYLGIQAIGSDIDYRSGLRTGSILLERMTIAGH